jgi:hypothetical protein
MININLQLPLKHHPKPFFHHTLSFKSLNNKTLLPQMQPRLSSYLHYLISR